MSIHAADLRGCAANALPVPISSGDARWRRKDKITFCPSHPNEHHDHGLVVKGKRVTGIYV